MIKQQKLVMALGLFLGPGRNGGLAKNEFRKLVGRYHDWFKGDFGSSCCRELIADFRKDRRRRTAFCTGLTGSCTAEAVRVILERRPELVAGADKDFLGRHDSRVAVNLQKIMPKWLGKTAS